MSIPYACGRPTSAPRIADRLEEEQRLAARYTAVTAAACIPFQGETLNLSGLVPHADSLDRDIRHAAAAAHWSFFADEGDTLDTIFDELVKPRDGVTRELGDENFVALGYRRMRRVGYGPDDVARFRDQIVQHVVPLVSRLMERQRIANGWDHLYAWDLSLADPEGNPEAARQRDRPARQRAGAVRPA